MNSLSPLIGVIVIALVCACTTNASSFGPSQVESRQEALAKRGYVQTGVTHECVIVPEVGALNFLNDIALWVRGDDARFLNHLDGDCRIDNAGTVVVSYRTNDSLLCTGDVVDIADSDGKAISTCVLGQFEALLKLTAPPDNNIRE
ncbi:MAG: hypothetical protein AAGB02_02935 [Pseudomonadota bacterium]